MSRDAWNELVARARAVDVADVLRERGIELRGRGPDVSGPCPVCCDGRDRFSVHLRKQLFFCRQCGRGGRGTVDLTMFLDGCEFVQAVKTLTGAIRLSTRSPAADAAEAAAKRKREEERDEQKQHEKARWLWSQRRPVPGSPVERYLRECRGYHDAFPPTLGFLPPRGDYPPAMIGAYALPNEIEPGELGPPLEISAVHLTRILPDGTDRERGKGAKITIGRPLGRPIAISSITDGLSLVVTEGIEDALAYRADGFAAWAAGSGAFFPALEQAIPDYLTSISIEVHPDKAAEQGAARLRTLLRQREVRPVERKPRPLFVCDERPEEFYPAERPIEIFLRRAQ